MRIDELIKMRAQHFFDNKKLFCALMLALHEAKITTHDGAAVRRARFVYVEGGIALISHNHSDDRCEVLITQSPDIEIIAGINDSGGHHDPQPHAGKGELIAVWADGKPVKSGPWDSKVRDTIESALSKLRESVKPKAEEKNEPAEDEIKKQKDADLKDAWAEDGSVE